MKIGVWLDDSMLASAGGSYTYIGTINDGINNFDFDPKNEIVFISENSVTGLKKPHIAIKSHQHGASLPVKIFRKLLKFFPDTFKHVIDNIDQQEKKVSDASVCTFLKSQEVKIIFYPAPATRVISGIPYIVNNWDLGHYVTFPFPEIADNDGFINRNIWYQTVVTSALLIFCETETGKGELVNYLNLNPERIRVLPIFSSKKLLHDNLQAVDQLAILDSFGLKKNTFFFYPAQFWAHKNHYTLVNAFQKFQQMHPEFKLVLCGSNKGEEGYIKKTVGDLGMENSVLFTSFVNDETLYTFYKNARALVMPTFFGPSNIPPIEALQLGCAVLCSDLGGHREILGDSGLYFRPEDEHSMLNCMEMIINDDTYRDLQIKQKDQLKNSQHTIENALVQLNNFLLEAANIRNCWE